MSFPAAKALHIIGFISWFAGLFYIVRLFVYHAESSQRPAAERDVLLPQLELMASRLWKIITVPAMIVTVCAGLWMVWLKWVPVGIPVWLWIKLGALATLIFYHHWCGRIRRQQAAGTSKWTPKGLRVFNEGATMLMVGIVCLAVFKEAMSMVWGMAGLLSLGISLMIGIKVYRRIRMRNPAA